MSGHPAVGEAFRRLQAGDVAGALQAALRACEEDPSDARARLAAGVALRMSGRLDEALEALERAAALAPGDHAPAYEIGIVRQLQGRIDDALAQFERCAALKPDFIAAPFSAAMLHADRRDWARAAAGFRAVLAIRHDQPDALLSLAVVLERDGRHDEAENAYANALGIQPAHLATLRAFGQYSASRGRFDRAASLFAEARRLAPGDTALPMFHAQCELLLGRFANAWEAYARRESRRRFAREREALGRPYAPPRASDLAGREWTLVAEQGLGDTLFFLRWAPRLRDAGARLAFAGDPRLHGMLARTGLFDSLAEASPAAAHPILVGDLPSMFASDDPLAVPSLRIAPLAERVERWRSALEAAGPRPWVGALWRAGTRRDVVAHALEKSVPVEALFEALAKMPGTIACLQRAPRPEELGRAALALGRAAHDFCASSEDPEDALAIASLLDRHVTVSNTNVHLAAAAGAGDLDILAPFPPEWRWRPAGDSPWFPGYRVHRQEIDGDWSRALGQLRAT